MTHGPINRQALWLIGGTMSLLVVASLIGFILQHTIRSQHAQDVIKNLNARIRSWWVMAAIFAAALFTGGIGSIFLFGITSFLALREFITLTPTKRGDHRSLFWIFFIILPFQYVILGMKWYDFFSVFIPVYAFILLPIRSAISGDYDRFLERTSKIQWGLMVCVYFVSYAPAILILDIPGYQGRNASLLFFFVLVVQMSDVLQYVWGKSLGKHQIAPHISPSKTWEGFWGGIGCATALGAALFWATPFNPWQAAAMSLLITLMGFGGGLTMSAIKRDRGVKDYGSAIPGHGGIMDRIDSLCFAVPVFFHVTRHYFT